MACGVVQLRKPCFHQWACNEFQQSRVVRRPSCGGKPVQKASPSAHGRHVAAANELVEVAAQGRLRERAAELNNSEHIRGSSRCQAPRGVRECHRWRKVRHCPHPPPRKGAAAQPDAAPAPGVEFRTWWFRQTKQTSRFRPARPPAQTGCRAVWKPTSRAAQDSTPAQPPRLRPAAPGKSRAVKALSDCPPSVAACPCDARFVLRQWTAHPHRVVDCSMARRPKPRRPVPRVVWCCRLPLRGGLLPLRFPANAFTPPPVLSRWAIAPWPFRLQPQASIPVNVSAIEANGTPRGGPSIGASGQWQDGR